MFRAFFDESGSDGKSKAFVMGGFVGRVEEWLKASDAWDACLRKEPKIAYFKYSEWQSLGGQFRRSNRKQADRKMLALANVIGNFDLHGFCAIVPRDVARKRSAGKGKPTGKGLIGTRVYDWGFADAIKLVLQYMRSQSAHEKVDFVFDNCSQLTANIENFHAMKENPFFAELMSHAGGCDPGNDREIAALQMADLLAGEFLRAGETQVQSESLIVIRDRNKIGYTRSIPPVQHGSMLDLMNLGSEILHEAGEFLRLDRQKVLSREETLEKLLDLLRKKAYFDVQSRRMVEFLENDPAYQDFRRKYIASTGIDPFVIKDDEGD